MIGFIENYSLVINISSLVVLTLVLVLNIIKSRNFPIAQTCLYGVAFIATSIETIGKAFNIASINDFVVLDLGLGFYATILVAEVFLVMHIVFFYSSREDSRGNKLFQAVPSSIPSAIYAYLDKYNEVLLYTEHFYNKIKLNDEEAKKWYKKALKFTIGEAEYKYAEFLKFLKKTEENEFNVVIEFNDFRSEEFNIVKTKITEKNKTLGYILVDKLPTAQEVYEAGTNKEFKIQLYQYFNSLNEAVGYYDNDEDKYRLTEQMAKRLGINELVIDLETLKNFICEDDLENFENEAKQEKGTLSYRYRLKTVSGLQWHEEVRTVIEGIAYSVFRKLELIPSKVTMNTKETLREDLALALEEGMKFGVVYVAVKKFIEIIESFGQDFADMVVDNYFGFLTEELLGRDTKIYRLSDYEFAFAVSDMTEYDELVRNISANTSPVINYDLYYGSTKYELDNNVGLVASKDILIKNADEVIKALEASLELAKDEKYAKNFSIYVAKSINDESYKFEDHVVDIDNKFLDE